MNSLNLRVSTVKTGENVKKNAEIRAALVVLPKKYELSEESYCQELRNAKSVPEQTTAVKDIFKNLGSDPKALQFLADMFFYSPLKHPVRNQILKLLITAARFGTGEIDESSIVTALTQTLGQLIEETKIETESNKWNLTVTSVTGCFENFECGLKALQQTLSAVFPFLYASVQKYLTELGVLSSPSVRNEYYLYVHNSIRLVLSCVQEFSKAIKEHHSDQLKLLNVVCKQIILDDEIPMDPRTNSGILMAQIAKIFEEYDSTFIQEVKLTKNPNEIALCVGIVNTFDQRDFQNISADIRDICSKIDEIANANATVPNILLCAARALYQLSKIMLSFDLKSQATTDDAKLILRKLLIFAFGYLEHHMDSVRHICRDLLRNIVAEAKKLKFDFLLQKIYDACNSERLSLSMKCVVLQQAAQVLGANEIIKNCPGLFNVLFAEHLGQDFMVNNLFEGLMTSSRKELPYTEWFDLWVQYLLNVATQRDNRLVDIEILIVKAVKCEPKIVGQIIERRHRKIPVSTKLSTLWAVRKEGIKMENFNEIMQKFTKCLLLSILSNSNETRIMALRLLVETHKTTELLTPLECEHILTYLEYNSNNQSPATRQKSLCLLGKALMRCELNLVKTLKESKTRPPPTTSTQTTGHSKGATSKVAPAVQKPQQPPHLKFLSDFMHILVSNLFRGANFSRRSVSLQLLEQCVRICLNLDLKLSDTLPKQTIKTLVEVLNDSYEANKELAVNILKLIEDHLDYSLIKRHDLPISTAKILEYLLSIRPLDSSTASYQLEFFCNRADSKDFGGDFELTTYSPTRYAALRWLLANLKVSLKMAKHSLMQAVKTNPMYGMLLTIKYLMQQLNFTILAKEIQWRIVVSELIVLCKELTSVVGPVVNSSSPEGHLPNDFSELPAEYAATPTPTTTPTPTKEGKGSGGSTPRQSPCKILSSKNAGKLDLTNVKTTPQMVLLCAWRTVKEVSLILGDIVLRSPIQFNKLTEEFLITKEQILEIGEHFKHLLSETKHRGAFEQAYVGFSKLCCRLWRVESSDLNSLPMQWLRDLITLISKDEQINEKICSTRRSAGVPFMVQALITSELQVGSTKSLNYCMAHLLQLAGAAERSSESRTHALNILRALFRCTDLNEAVGEYVSDGVTCSIRGYDAGNWSEKNSATLLFASLITRIFGVQRTKDSENLNIRNKMTGRVFFLRYPKLYDFFLNELQAASALTLQQKKSNKLHPLLLILSRLYPSALEGTESNLKLTEFIPYIQNCAGCAELPTRVLASKAVVALISRDAVPVAILRKCSEIVFSADQPSTINRNVLHGQLLQILMLLKTHKHLEAELISDICCSIVAFHERTQLKNAVIIKVMLDIFIEILSGLTNLTFSQETIQNLLYFSTKTDLDIPDLSYFYPVLRKSFFIYNLHTLRLTLPFGAISDYLLNPPVTHESVKCEHAESCLNIILLVLLCNKQPNADNEIIEFEISAVEVRFVRALSADTLDELATELWQSKALEQTLKQVVQDPNYYPECAMKAYAILSLLENFNFTLSSLMAESKKHPGDVKSPITMCVERMVLKQGVDYKTSQTCLEYLLEISQPWNPDCLRLKSSKILSHLAVHYPRALEKRKLTFVRLYVGLILALLMDDDYEIRDNTAKIVLKSLSDDLEMETVVSTMAQRLFLQATADILVSIKADDNYVIEIFKIITETLSLGSDVQDEDNNSNGSGGDASNSASTASIASDLEIFDKSESNAFAEPLKAIDDCIVVFRTTFGHSAKVSNFVNEFKVC